MIVMIDVSFLRCFFSHTVVFYALSLLCSSIRLPLLRCAHMLASRLIQRQAPCCSNLMEPSARSQTEQLFSWCRPCSRALTWGKTNNLASLPQSKPCKPAGEVPWVGVCERETERERERERCLPFVEMSYFERPCVPRKCQ